MIYFVRQRPVRWIEQDENELVREGKGGYEEARHWH